MDLDYLYSRYQISLTREKVAASPEARHAHGALARAYAERIRDLRIETGVDAVAMPGR